MGPVEPSLWKPTAVRTVYGKRVASAALRSIWATVESARIWSRVSLGFSSVKTDMVLTKEVKKGVFLGRIYLN